MTLKRDWILRILEQLQEALASTQALRRKGALAEAEQEVDRAAASVAGVDLRMAAVVDAATLASHVPEPARLAALARLVLERADLARERGDGGEARWRKMAIELWLDAASRGAELDATARAAIEAFPAEALSPRARGQRERLAGGGR